MKKITIEGFIRHTVYPWSPETVHYTFDTVLAGTRPPEDGEWTVNLQRHQIQIDVPDNFDPVPQKIAALQAKKNKLLADAHVAATEVEEQIRNLQALTFTPSEPA